MAQIPTFVSTQSYGSGVAEGGQIPLSAAGMVGNALAEGFKDAANQFAQVGARLREQQSATDASALFTEGATSLADLRLKYEQDPNPSDAAKRFQADATALQASLLERTQDPRVRALVANRFATHAVSEYIGLARISAGRWNQDQNVSLTQDVTQQASLLASAPNQAARDVLLSNIESQIRARAEIGGMTPAQALVTHSNALQQAIVEVAAKPGGAIAANEMFQSVKSKMTSGDIMAVTTALRAPLRSAAAGALAATELNIVFGRGAPAAGSGGGGGNSGPVPTDPDGRARYAFDFYIKRGKTPEAAAAAVAQIKHESNFNERATHDGGIGTGILGWNGPRRKALEAKHGPNSTFDQQLDFLDDELEGRGGDAGMAQVGQAMRRPGMTASQAAADMSSIGVRPRDVEGNRRVRGATAENYLRQFGGNAPAPVGRDPVDGSASAPPPGPGRPSLADWDAADRRVMAQYADDPEMQQAVLGRLGAARSRYEHQFDAERRNFEGQVKDMHAALAMGRDDVTIPADKIRSMYPAEIAEPKIRELEISRSAGQAMLGVRGGTPEQVAATRATLAAPQGEGESIEGFAHRQQVLGQFDNLVAHRAKALNDDGAAYVASSPAVQAQVQALQNKVPGASMERVIQASMGEQERLGNRGEAIRPLSKPAVTELVGKIMKTDPAKGDMQTALVEAEQAYGSTWPAVFGQLVRDGKLPAEYQVLANMRDPKQVVAADHLQRALTIGQKALDEGLEGKVKNDIAAALRSNLAPFQAALAANGTGSARGLYNSYWDASKALASWYVFNGKGAAEAAEMAVKGTLTERWDFSGTMMFPKGQGDQVQAAARNMQRAITPEVLEQVSNTQQYAHLRPEDRQAAWTRDAQRGDWVPNANGTGLVLMAPLFNGGRLPVRMSDGTPIELLFDRLPTVAPRRAVDLMPAAPLAQSPASMRTYDQ